MNLELKSQIMRYPDIFMRSIAKDSDNSFIFFAVDGILKLNLHYALMEQKYSRFPLIRHV